MAEGGEGAFDFDRWCEENNINETTRSKLRAEDLVGKEDLIHLSIDDISKLGLTIGQGKNLHRKIEQLKPPEQRLASAFFGSHGSSSCWVPGYIAQPASQAACSVSAHSAVEVDDSSVLHTGPQQAGSSNVQSPRIHAAHTTRILGPQQRGFMEFLEMRGLDGDYWCEKFEEKLKITSQHQIRNLSATDLTTLLECVQIGWEKKGLTEIFVDLGVLNTPEQPIVHDTPSVDRSLSQNTIQSLQSGNVSRPEFEFDRILRELDLLQYHPSKVSLQQVMAIKDTAKPGTMRVTDLAFELLHRLIMLEWESRDNVQQLTLSPERGDTSVALQELNISFFSSSFGVDSSIHPQDLLLVAFLCSDNMLKQTLMQKLFLCRLAVPFIYPTGGQLELAQWSMRSVVVDSKEVGNKIVERCIVNAPLHIVSFCRFGDCDMSKSKLVNEVISNDPHPAFFHRDCPNGMSKRHISSGMLEASLSLPSNKGSDLYDNIVMFWNLRGDGLMHTRQLSLIGDVSSVVVGLVDTSSVVQPDVLLHIESVASRQKMILLLTGSSISKEQLSSIDIFKTKLKDESKANISCLSVLCTSGRKNATVIKTEIQRALRNLLKPLPPFTLDSIAPVIRARGVVVDEDIDACQRGHDAALTVFEHVQGKKVQVIKSEMLPLQDHWVKWSKLQKKATRAVGKGKQQTARDETIQFQKEMDEVRTHQSIICKSPTPLHVSFIRVLTQCYIEGKLKKSTPFLLQWLKCMFDDLSRSTLPDLQREYQEMWKDFHRARNVHNVNPVSLKSKNEKMMTAEKNLASASFGLEHVFREMGQMYEALKETKTVLDENLQAQIDLLPDIIAQLLISGHPFEIMDGDASNVPITWIDAIFGSLEKIVGRRKVYVISVLGVQSSGKSTLLNTMFGLQFAVSAGRCTRGVYMQLVNVDKERCSLPFDYVLVIDTEGLRAPELGLEKFDHDNEIATFVIGLGDVTVMNIKGENYAEMKDVLQIAVHAFVRMKLVCSYKLKRHRCLFVHQNVPAGNADDKLKQSSQKLQEILDKMTMEAATQEQRVDVKCFKQIIDFDCYNHVSFVSDLWHGDPPMAHANRGYTDKVQGIKSKILFELSSKQQTFLSMNDVSQRIKDLWKGILADDFVFCFRNCLEVKAYSDLERKVRELLWNIQSQSTDWLKNKAESHIMACNTEDEMRLCRQELLREANKNSDDMIVRNLTLLKQFCSEHFYVDLIVKWEASKARSLESEASDMKVRTRSEIDAMLNRHAMDLLYRSSDLKHQHEIMDKAIELATGMKARKNDQTFLDEQFQYMWKQWLDDLSLKKSDLALPLESIGPELEHILREEFAAHRSLLKTEIGRNSLTLCKIPRNPLAGSWNYTDIPPELLSIDFESWEYDKEEKQKHCQYQALEVCNSTIFQPIEEKLKLLCNEDIQFQSMHMKELLDIISAGVNFKDKGKVVFTFVPQLIVKIAVKVAQFAYPIFYDLHRRYQEKHGFASKLEIYRDKTYNLFKNTVRDREQEVIAADLFCDTIKEQIIETVIKKLIIDLPGLGIREFVTKQQLMFSVLDHLANEESFDKYLMYLQNPKSYVIDWMREYFDRVLFVKTKTQRSLYGNLAGKEVTDIVNKVKRSVTNSMIGHNKKLNASTWISAFCNNARHTIPISNIHLNMVARQNIKNIKTFGEQVKQGLISIEGKIIKRFDQVNASNPDWADNKIYEEIVDSLWGCDATCPFCGEPCQRSGKNHLEEGICHTCLQHRPQGMNNKHWHRTNELVTDTCNYAVQSDVLFECSKNTCVDSEICQVNNVATEDIIWHNFRNYKIHQPDWDIPPCDAKEVSKYWIWVFNKYNNQLADAAGLKRANIPWGWTRVNKMEARNSLRTVYGSKNSPLFALA